MPDPWSYADATNTEHAHQTALFMWANMVAEFGDEIAFSPVAYKVPGWAKTTQKAKPLPMLKWLHAIPNQGTESAKRGLAMKAEGLKSGVYDVFLPYPIVQENGVLDLPGMQWAGLYIEMKRPKTATQVAGKLSNEQEIFKAYAESVGYKCVECWTWLEARDAILQYLGVSQ